MILNARRFILSLLIIFNIFLTFKYLISIDFGFSIRIPHLLVISIFLLISLYFIIFRNIKLKFKDLIYLFVVIILVSVLNHSFKSMYLYYFIYMYIGLYSFYLILDYYRISPFIITKYSVLFTLAHVFLSYFTIYTPWQGGLQIRSFSDFSTFFAMQLSIIFPLIFLLNSKKWKIILSLIFLITIFLLGSRGALLALILMYMSIYLLKGNLKFLIYATSIFIILASVVYFINPEIINLYLMKINPFSKNYNAGSDMNRYFFIIATVTYLENWWNVAIGNGIKQNQNIVSDFMSDLTGVDFSVEVGGAVHNVFLEIYSDYGIFLTLFVVFLLFKYLLYFYNVSKYNNRYQPFFISLGTFIINYNLESNYVHYFFWFYFMLYTYTYTYIQRMKKCNKQY